MREYPEYVFEDFGFTIVDECHHLGAEVFSRSLPKYSTKYMLGLSATPKRKDGLSKVFEWYIGPYVFVVNQQNTRKVRVNMVYYYNINPAYNNIEVSNNGRVCMARMTNNICEFDSRNELLLEIFKKCSDDGEKSQTIGLSDRREHLKYLNQQIDERKIGSVGYYVGGMKQKDLKESESKKCLLGTFSMAAEAMDIPTLNRLILMTSHSDVVQSCGRILRKDHGDLIPEIWDFVDNFSVYANQAKKRLTHYKKEGYEIHEVRINDDDKMELYELKIMLNDFELVYGADAKKGKSKISKPGSLIKAAKDKPVKCLITDDDYSEPVAQPITDYFKQSDKEPTEKTQCLITDDDY
jgi:superfamily II DNA or RNA helicase